MVGTRGCCSLAIGLHTCKEELLYVLNICYGHSSMEYVAGTFMGGKLVQLVP